MGLFERANEIAVLSGGRLAEWVTQGGATALAQGGTNGVPSAVNDGVALGGSLKTLVVVDLRADPAKRQCKTTIPTPIDFAETYAVEIDGTRVEYDAGGAGATTLQEILEGLRDAMNANGTINVLVVASVIDDDGDGTDDTLLTSGLTGAHYSIETSPVTGPGVDGITLTVAEPDGLDLRVWASTSGIANPAQPSGWRLLNMGEFLALDALGFIERFDTGSFDRMALEVDQLAGTGDGAAVLYALPTFVIGPSKLP